MQALLELMANRNLTFYKFLLRKAFEIGVKRVSIEALRSLKVGRTFDLELVDLIIKQIFKNAAHAQNAIAEIQYNKFLNIKAVSEVNLLPLKSLQSERAAHLADSLKNYRHLVNQASVEHLAIGRRGQDVLREMTLKQLEKGFIRGDASFFVKDSFINELNKKKLFVNENISKNELFKLREEFFNKIPVFKKGEKLKFFLLNKNNKFMAFDAKYYGDLVAITTTNEARWSANYERARSQNTRFIQMSKTGKSKSQYNKEKDPICGIINGGIFSIVAQTQSGGMWGALGKSGKFYQYIKEIIKGKYLLPHPFCKHLPSPYPERFA